MRRTAAGSPPAVGIADEDPNDRQNGDDGEDDLPKDQPGEADGAKFGPAEVADDDGVREPHADLGDIAGDQRHRDTALQAKLVAETGRRFGARGGPCQILVRH